MLNDGDYITKDTMIALGESRYNQFKTSVGAGMGYGRYRDVISSPDPMWMMVVTFGVFIALRMSFPSSRAPEKSLSTRFCFISSNP